MQDEQQAPGVALISMACRFPGARSVEQLWTNLRGGVESIVRFSEEELTTSGIDPSWLRNPRYVPAGGPLEGVGDFDADLFGLTTREAAMMDPQHRLLLECAWEALESAGYSPFGIDGSVGVYAGSRMSEYLLFQQGPPDLVGVTRSSPINAFQALIANDKDYLATRIAYALGLDGPAISVQTACSTSLVAVHLACQALLDGECDLALAGGVSVRVPQRAGYLYSEGMIFSPDGHTRAFDAQAGGTVFSSGAGLVALKRLDDALADGDPIWAVIRGSAVNNDGAARKAGYTAPSQVGQARVISEAMAVAGIDARSIGCIEAHGTATALGDPIEVAALTEVFRAETDEVAFASLGSIKSNIGHTVQAAGVAGLIKAALQLHHRELAPTLHFEEPNPEIDFEGSPFVPQAELAPWPEGSTPRRAGVSSFGVGGTNAHLILEEAPVTRTEEPTVARAGHVLVLSAATQAAVDEWAGRFAEHLAKPPDGGDGVPLEAVCRTAVRRRSDLAETLAVSAPDGRRMIDRLQTAAGGGQGAGIVRGNRPAGAPTPKVAFLYSGQGSQFPGMGLELHRSEPVFRGAVERCAAIFDAVLDHSLEEILFGDEGELLGETLYLQPALFSLEVALTELWRSWGVEPDFVAGHSLGELAAVWAAGALTLEDGARLVLERARRMHGLPADGAMVVVFTDEERARAAVEAAGDGEVAVAAVNGPRNVILSGASEALAAVVARLEEEGVGSKALDVARAFHSPAVDRLIEPVQQVASTLDHLPARIPWMSNVTGRPLEVGERIDGAYWGRHMRNPVRFADCLENLERSGATVFVEIGPGTALLAMGRKRTPESNALWLASLRRGTAHRAQIFDALAHLAAAGAPVDWSGVDREPSGRHLALPTYPFQRRRHWIDRRSGQDGQLPRAAAGAAVSMLGPRLLSPIAESQYEALFDPDTPRFMRDHQVHGEVVFPAVGFLEMALSAASETFRTDRPSASQLTIREALLLPEGEKQVVHSVVSRNGDGAKIRIFARALQMEESDWRLVVESSLGEGPVPGNGHAAARSIEELRRRCPDELPVEDFYRRWRAEGVEHGESFRGIEALWTGTGEALGRIRAHRVVEEGAEAFQFHPALMSACLQVAEAVSKAADEGETEGIVYLPVIWERVVAHGRGTGLVWSHAVLRSNPSGGEIRTVDLRVMDDDGRPLLEVEGLHFKRASRAALRGGGRERRLDDWLYGVEWREAERPPAAEPAEGGTWLVFGGPDGLETALAERLQARADRVVVIEPGERFERLGTDRFGVRAMAREDFDALAGALKEEGILPDAGIVHLWSLRAPGGEELETDALTDAQRTLCGGLLHFVQALDPAGTRAGDGAAPLPFALVTRGAQAVHDDETVAVAQSTLWGLGRVIGQEHPRLRCRLIDLDPAGRSGGLQADEAAAVLEEIAGEGAEMEAGIRGGVVRVPRLVRSPSTVAADAGGADLGRPYRLGISERGALENLTLDPIERRPPGPGEVEVEIAAASLNFRDVLNALGRYPGDGPFGLDCAGVVSAVGPDVEELAVGDEVIAVVHDCIASHVTTATTLVLPKPSGMSLEEAASIPVVFLTAYHSLCHLGRISRGERVLIHAAAGGVGQAAIQLARGAGAEIFATAGSERKRSYLRAQGIRHVMSSRTPEFADRVLELTDGRGVDVVLNCLTGELAERSLEVVVSGGRFVEIGRGVFEGSEAPPVPEGVQYLPSQISRYLVEDPELLRRLLIEIVELFDQGELSAPPRRVVPIDHMVDAFRFMARARHIGKVVLTQGEHAGRRGVHGSATYLVTGGLGGIGLRLAGWLADRGASHLVLVGRSEPSEEAAAVLEELRERGVEVRVERGDVARSEEVKAIFERMAGDLPPLVGVFHAAGVLDDALMLEQDWDRFAAVLAPKVEGAWNLHRLTENLDLEHFVLFSSMGSLFGPLRRSNYAAASAFLDALAHHRHARGLPAIAVDWGSWRGLGMTADLETRSKGLDEVYGLGQIKSEEGLELLGSFLVDAPVQVGAIPVRWGKYFQRYAEGQIPTLYEDLVEEARAEEAERSAAAPSRGSGGSVGVLDPADLVSTVSAQIAAVLGIAVDEVGPDDPITSLGVDSLMSIELRNQLQSLSGVELPLVKFMEGPTAREIADLLAPADDSEPPSGDLAPGVVAGPAAETDGRWEEGEL